MKPSIKDIQVERNKANFVSYLLTRFNENEFTNSEMKKVYNEDITNTIERASGHVIRRELVTMLNDPASGWGFKTYPIKNYTLYKDKKVVHVVFDAPSKSVMDIPYCALARYIAPYLDFPSSYALNSEVFQCEGFFTERTEEITIRKCKAVGRVGWNDYNFEGTLSKWSSEEQLRRHFINGEYHFEFEDVDTFRYYFKLDRRKAANYCMEQQRRARNLREERTKCLVDEMPEEDRQEILEYLADQYGYWLE